MPDEVLGKDLTRGAEAVRHALRQAVDEAGSIRSWARSSGVSEGYARRVLSGSIAPGKSLLGPLGFRKVVLYERVEPEGEQRGSGSVSRRTDG